MMKYLLLASVLTTTVLAESQFRELAEKRFDCKVLNSTNATQCLECAAACLTPESSYCVERRCTEYNANTGLCSSKEKSMWGAAALHFFFGPIGASWGYLDNIPMVGVTLGVLFSWCGLACINGCLVKSCCEGDDDAVKMSASAMSCIWWSGVTGWWIYGFVAIFEKTAAPAGSCGIG